MIISGFDRVYEIGQCFRNEGIDATHNPEFTTCEFYQAFANLDDLITLTEELLRGLARATRRDLPIVQKKFLAEDALDFELPFKKIDFVSAIKEKLEHKISAESLESFWHCANGDNLGHNAMSSDTYFAELLKELRISPPAVLTIPRYLERLFEEY